MSYDAVLFFDGPGFCADVFFSRNISLRILLLVLLAFESYGTFIFYFRVAIWDARKACRAYYSVALWLCAGALGEHLSPRFARRAARNLHPHVHFSHTESAALLARVNARTNHDFFFCRQIGKFVIIRLWIWIFFRFFLQIKSTKSETRR